MVAIVLDLFCISFFSERLYMDSIKELSEVLMRLSSLYCLGNTMISLLPDLIQLLMVSIWEETELLSFFCARKKNKAIKTASRIENTRRMITEGTINTGLCKREELSVIIT